MSDINKKDVSLLLDDIVDFKEQDINKQAVTNLLEDSIRKSEGKKMSGTLNIDGVSIIIGESLAKRFDQLDIKEQDIIYDDVILILASFDGHIETIQKLLSQPNIITRDCVTTIITLLKDRALDVNLENSEGDPIVYKARKKNDVEIIKLLEDSIKQSEDKK